MRLLSLLHRGSSSTPPPPADAEVSHADAVEAASESEAREARRALVEQIASGHDPYREGRSLSPRVLEAMRAVPRHFFVPQASLREAYADAPHPIGLGQTISQPTIVAIMTDALELEGHERVLEVGTGCGYQTAVLSRLAREVASVEILEALATQASSRLAALGCTNVTLRVGSGYDGWSERAPFDRIILTAAPPALPARLPLQLVDGGMIVAPVGSGDAQRLFRWRRHGCALEETDLGAVRFVPMVTAAN